MLGRLPDDDRRGIADRIAAPVACDFVCRSSPGGPRGIAEEDVISTVRIALANIRIPTTPDDSVHLATAAVGDAGRQGAAVICFPECFIPGYRWPGHLAPPPDPAFLDRARATVAEAARLAGVAVILGMERVTDRGLQISVCVINSDGILAGWQDKGQVDPSEEGIYPALGSERRLFVDAVAIGKR